MRMNKHIHLIAAATLLLLPGCVKEPDAGSITVDASIGPATKVAYDGAKSCFAAGDKIAIYAWTGSAAEIPATRVVDGVVNTYDGNAWTPASLMRWKNGTDAHYFLGVSPVHTISDLTADPYTVDPAEYTASDLLFAANLGGVQSGDDAVKLGFRHAMGQLRVNLNFRSQWTSTPEVSAVTLNAKTKASVNYLTQAVSATGDASAVSLPAATAASGYARSYGGLVVPQDGVRKITVTIGGKDYVYTAGEDIPLASGQVTTVNLNVGRDQYVLELASAITISDWVDDSLPDREISIDLGYHFTAELMQKEAPMQAAWKEGDVIYVFFSQQAAPKHLEMMWDGSAWVFSERYGLKLADGETGVMTAVFLPFGSGTGVLADEGMFLFDKPYPGYYFTRTLAYEVLDGKVSANFEMAIPEGYVQFFLADEAASGTEQIELREPHLTPQGLVSLSAEGTFTHSTAARGAPMIGMYCSDAGEGKKGWCFSGILAAADRNVSADYHFTVVRGGWKGDYYGKSYTEAASNAMTLYTGFKSDRAVTLPALTGWTAITDNKPIDLNCDVDLPGGGKKRIYWSSRNLGASSDYPTSDTDEAWKATWGDYYAWGELEPYYKEGHAYDNPMDDANWRDGKFSGYTSSSYRFGTFSSVTKYNVTDGLDVLEPEDDAARVNLGGIWRIPTKEEWSNLQLLVRPDDSNKAVVAWTVGTIWEVPTIYLPYAGYRVNDDLEKAGSDAFYWTSTVDMSLSDYAFEAQMNKGFEFIGSSHLRICGFSVRPVTD